MSFTEDAPSEGAKTGRRKAAAAPGRNAAFRWRLLAAPEPDNDAEPAPPRPRAPRSARSFPRFRARPARLDPVVATRLLALWDWAVLAGAATVAASVGAGAAQPMTLVYAAAILAPLAPIKLGLWLFNAYGASRPHAEGALAGAALGAITGLGLSAFFAADARTGGALAAAIPIAAAAITGMHAALGRHLGKAARAGDFAEKTVLVGASDAAAAFITHARQHGRFDIVAVIDDRLARAPRRLDDAPVAGDIDDLLAWRRLPEIDRIVLCIDAGPARMRALIDRLRPLPNRLDLLIDYNRGAERVAVMERRHDGAALLHCLSGGVRRPMRAFLKRAMDAIIGAALAVLLTPLMALIAAAVACDSPGPVFTRQRRHGLNNRVIEVRLFRTMKHEAAARGRRKSTKADDARVTRVGRVLRAARLDEIPLIWSVLAGDMSLIGPRAHAIGAHPHRDPHYAHRARMKPGLTGWAQINAAHARTTADAARERLRLDLDYIAHASVWLDLWILVCAVPAWLRDLARRK